MIDHHAAPKPWTLEPTLPRRWYIDADCFALERERIFVREWLCVGRAEAIANPGDYLLLDVVGEQILVTRTRTGALSAAYNVCRHRGCELAFGGPNPPTAADTPPASGTFPGVIRCPYHSWTYELDGRLRSAPHLNEQIDKAAFGLHPVALDTWGGFIWINLDPDHAACYPLAAQIGAGIDYCKNYPLADLRTARRFVYDVAANWKVIVENYNECYHCAGVHPELCEVVPAFRHGGGTDLDWSKGVPHKEGAFTYTFSGTTNRAPFPGLDADEQVLHKAWLFLPNLMLSLAAEHAAAFTLWPIDADHTRIVCDLLFHPSEIAKPDFNPSDTADFWDLVNQQDWTICAGVQRGMHSRSFRSGYFAPMEHESLDTRRYLKAKLGAAMVEEEA